MQSGNYSFKGAGGTGLTGRYWKPDGNLSAVVSLTHGLGEHKGRYQHVGEYLSQQGIGLYAYDLRGHGNADGKRGHTPSYGHLLDDLANHLEVIKINHPDTPLFLYGHSLGGNIVANYLVQRNNSPLSGGILSAPWLTLAKKPPALQVAVARIVNAIAPAMTQSNQLNPNHLSTDPAVAKSYADDPLVHDRLSVALFFGAYPAGLQAIQQAAKVRVPVLGFHGTDDHITGIDSTRAFTDAAPKGIFKAWEGMRHEPHNEPDKGSVLELITDFVLGEANERKE